MFDLDNSDSRLIIFIILVILILPSIICSLYIFHNFIRFRIIRKRVNNHIILLLLIICFIQVTGELPLSLVFLRTGSPAILSDKFCEFWVIFNYTCFSSALWTMAIASIERYVLVFHQALFNKYIVFFHYIPMILCIIYPMVLYIIFIMAPICTNIFDYSFLTCGGGCYLYETDYGIVDWIVNGCINILLSALATCILIIRILTKKRRVVTQREAWKRSRRIIIQLIPLSILYMIIWLPSVICFLIPIFSPAPFLSEFYSAYLLYYQYLSCLLCPFACLLCSSEIRVGIRHNQVVPVRAIA